MNYIKKEIISRRGSGKSLGLSAEYGMAKSTISTILKNKEEMFMFFKFTCTVYTS